MVREHKLTFSEKLYLENEKEKQWHLYKPIFRWRECKYCKKQFKNENMFTKVVHVFIKIGYEWDINEYCCKKCYTDKSIIKD